MQRLMVGLALAAAWSVPLAASVASAQSAPDAMRAPSPAMRVRMEGIDVQARASSYAARSADHRARVQAIVARVTSGALDPRAAVTQIDALLSPDEAKGVMAVAITTRAQMRAAFTGDTGTTPPTVVATPPGGGANGPAGAPPNGAAPAIGSVAPNGGPPANGAAAPNGGASSYGGPGGGMRRPMTAGAFLLRVSITPEQMRALRAAQRSATPAP